MKKSKFQKGDKKHHIDGCITPLTFINENDIKVMFALHVGDCQCL